MKWYLTPSNREFSDWKPRAIAKHLGNVSLPVNEPLAKLIIGVNTLYPLVDDNGSPEPYQTSMRTITVGADVATAVYTYANKPLDDYKAQRKTEVRELRKLAEKGGISVSGLTIPTDDKTQSRVDQIVKAYEDGDITGTIDFELPDGAFVALNQAQMQSIKAAGAQHIQACFSRQKALVEAIDAASDHAAVEAIDITTGWPG